MVLYSKFVYGSQFSGEKTVCKSITWFTSYANSRIQENSWVFLKRPVQLQHQHLSYYGPNLIKILNYISGTNNNSNSDINSNNKNNDNYNIQTTLMGCNTIEFSLVFKGLQFQVFCKLMCFSPDN